MAVQMIGIDHTMAVIDIRTIFSFTKKKCREALEILKGKRGIKGCVLLSTCNRMELWVSTDEEFQGDLLEILCQLKEADPGMYREYFVERKGEDAVWHLFRLSSGLESRILGEDQIITQVKDALSLARECYSTDNVLEVLFRMAVTGAKKVKTELIISDASHSVIHQALSTLKKEGFSVNGKKCMVIGNGAMGKLAATVLAQEGAHVTVTVRQYRSGIVDIPVGCHRIDYGDRMGLFPQCDFVVSATASPNYTIKEEVLRTVDLNHDMVLIDLAVPRDVEPSVAKLNHIRLYDIDYFKVDPQSEKTKENIRKAEEILSEQKAEFYNWYECRDIVPKIQRIKEDAAEDLRLRIQKIIHGLPMRPEEQEELLKSVEAATLRSVNKMMFGLRDTVRAETFLECLEGLEKVYEG